MRRIAGIVIVILCLAILIHDAATGRRSTFQAVFDQKELDTRLVNAVDYEGVDAVSKALRRGANPNLRVEFFYTISLRELATLPWQRQHPEFPLNGDSPFPRSTILHYAIRNEMWDIAAVLVERGANVDATDGSGATPLHWAAYGFSGRTAEILIAAGAKVNARDADGRTPLHYAAGALDSVLRPSHVPPDVYWKRRFDPSFSRGQKDMIQVLIAHGADINAKANDGLTPLDGAEAAGKHDIAGLLRQHGGQTGKEIK